MIRISLAAAAFALVTVGATGREPADESADVYILAGQSNMSGHGRLDELTAAERTSDADIRLFGNDDEYRPALDPLDAAEGQVDMVSADPHAGVGPGMFFAREMRKRRGRPVVLVPCAKGGSSIAQWTPGGGSDTLYGSCLRRAQKAGAGHIAGILWYQGEADATTPERAADWSSAFGALVARFRADLDREALPVVFVGLADKAHTPARAARYPGWEQVQRAQAAFRMPCTVMVSARGLAQNPDELHLATAGQRILGKKLAKAMDGLERRCS